jgi:hypothetical protein
MKEIQSDGISGSELAAVAAELDFVKKNEKQEI